MFNRDFSPILLSQKCPYNGALLLSKCMSCNVVWYGEKDKGMKGNLEASIRGLLCWNQRVCLRVYRHIVGNKAKKSSIALTPIVFVERKPKESCWYCVIEEELELQQMWGRNGSLVTRDPLAPIQKNQPRQHLYFPTNLFQQISIYLYLYFYF